MSRARGLAAFAGLTLVIGALTSCASPAPTPSPTPAAPCGALGDVLWSTPVVGDPSLTDVQVVEQTADGYGISEASGFPLHATVPADLTSDQLGSLISDFQVHHERPLVLGTADTPVVTSAITDWSRNPPGRYILFAGGKEVSAPFRVRCTGNSTSVTDTLHLWSDAEQGILQCSRSSGRDALASLAQAFCVRS